MLTESFISVLISIGKAHIIVIAFFIVSFVLEQVGFILFYKDYIRPKSPRQAEIADSGNIGTYMLIMIGRVIYDMYKGNMEFNFFTITFSFIIIFVLTKYSYRLHKKYQAVDPNKADDDFA